MKRGFFLLLAWGIAAVFPLGAEAADIRDGLLLRVDASTIPATGRPFRIETADVLVDGVVRYDPAVQQFSLRGTYTTRRTLEAETRLSYQLYDSERNLLQRDGERFDWQPGPTGPRSTPFELNLGITLEQPDLPAIEVQFNYVVEHHFWYDEKYPALKLPAILIFNLPDRAHFEREYALVPRIVPAQTKNFVPIAWAVLSLSNPPRAYLGSVEIKTVPDARVIDGPRLPTLPVSAIGGSVLQWQPFVLPEPGRYKIRPGFVWNNVRWYSGYEDNAFVTVTAVPPLTYAGMVTAFVLMFGVWWRGIHRIPLRWGRRLARVGWFGFALATGTIVLTSGYLVLVLMAATAWWVLNRPWRVGEKTYGLLLVFIALLEFYWGVMGSTHDYAPKAMLVSFCGMALALFPMTWIRRVWLARLLGCTGVPAGLLAVTGLVVYYQFFSDFPSVRDLQYATQIGELGGSLQEMIGQMHLIPIVLSLALASLFFAPAFRRGSEVSR